MDLAHLSWRSWRPLDVLERIDVTDAERWDVREVFSDSCLVGLAGGACEGPEDNKGKRLLVLAP